MRVLLVDQNDDFLDGVSALLANASDLEVVGRAHSAVEALESVHRLAPDLVLMGAALADSSGFETARWMKAQRPAPVVLLMMFHESRAAGIAALAAGADGSVSMLDVAQKLLPAIEKCLADMQSAKE